MPLCMHIGQVYTNRRIHALSNRRRTIFMVFHHDSSKSDVRRQTETSAEHAFLGTHVTNVPYMEIWRLQRERVSELLRNLFAYLHCLPFVVITFSREAVNMYHWQFAIRVGRKDLLSTAIQADKSIQESSSCRRKIHHVVVESFWLLEHFA